jgi:hypothetical protein
MTGHLAVDVLAGLVGIRDPASVDDHLAGCELCRERLSNLRARSAEVTRALGGLDGVAGETMPADVTLRITAALTAARGVPTVEPTVEPPVGRSDDLALARERRRGRLRGLLVAAAVVVVIGGGFGAIVHLIGGAGSAATSAGGPAAGAASGSTTRPSAGADLSAPSPATGTGTAPANPRAARGTLLEASFADDAKVFVAAQGRPTPASARPLAGGGSARCATTARGEASSTAGYKAGGGNAAPAALVGAVTVDGRAGVLYLVDVGPVKVAVALSDCSTGSPVVLASALL